MSPFLLQARSAGYLYSGRSAYLKSMFSRKRANVIDRSIQTLQQVEPDYVAADTRVEEETLPDYRAERYFPVKIGDTFHSRYQIITKLGYGGTSTTWLCRDLLENRHLTLKAHVRTRDQVPEIEISRHLNTIKGHVGAQFVRVVMDSFEVEGEHGVFPFTIYPPAGIDLDDVMHMYDDKMFNEELLKAAVRDILVGMAFLQQADVIHTDIHPSNILLGIGEGTTLSDMELAESSNPSTQKNLADRTIYLSRYMPVTYGRPLIADLGEARIVREKQTGLIMPDIYRSPEVTLGMEWDNKVDIWAISQNVWSLFQGKHMFKNRDSLDRSNRARRLAETVSIIGPPPAAFLERSPETLEFWDKNGNWKGLEPVPDGPLEAREQHLTGDDKATFLQFIRKTLQWLPKDRPTAEELVFDDWVRGDLY